MVGNNIVSSSVVHAVAPMPMYCRPLLTNPHSTWTPDQARVTLNLALDRTDNMNDDDEEAEFFCHDGCAAASSTISAAASSWSSVANIVVIDDFIEEQHRIELLEYLTTEQHDPAFPEGPPEAKWEKKTSDGHNLPRSWGVKPSVMRELEQGNLPAMREIHSRLTALYPHYIISHIPPNEAFIAPAPSTAAAGSVAPVHVCDAFVANAAQYGDCFQWHMDADPCSFPPSCPFSQHYSSYVNHTPGKPLFVSVVLYLDKFWPRHLNAETMFLDADTDTGVFVRPKGRRVVIMDQDVLHRLSTPSQQAGMRPRFSLVWKLLFFPRPPLPSPFAISPSPNAVPSTSPLQHPSFEGREQPSEEGQVMTIVRPDWGPPVMFGSAATLLSSAVVPPSSLRSVDAPTNECQSKRQKTNE